MLFKKSSSINYFWHFFFKVLTGFWQNYLSYEIIFQVFCWLKNDRSVTDDIPPLQNWRNFVSLSVMYRYFYGCCSEKLHDMVLSLLPRPRVTRGLNDAHRSSLSPISCKTHGYKQSFFPWTINLWNSLPNQCFSENCNMNLFMKRWYTYFTSGWDDLWCHRWFS